MFLCSMSLMDKIRICSIFWLIFLCLWFTFRIYADFSITVWAQASFMDSLDEKYHLHLDDNLLWLPLYTDGSLVVDPNPSLSWVTMLYEWAPFFEYQPGKYLYKLFPDGTRDFTFDWWSWFDGDIIQVWILPNDKIIVVGRFNSYKWITVRKVVCLNEDGTLDETYNAGGSWFWSTNNYYPLLIESDGKVIVMGDDYTYNGQAVSGIVRLDVDGTLDDSFNASYIRGQYGYGALEQPDGKILIFGAPYNVSQSKVYGILRLNADGSRDTTFNNGWSWVLYNFIWIAVYNAVLDDEGNIIMVWSFGSYNGVSSPWIARLFPDGTIDTTFASNIWLGFSNDRDVESLLLQPDGKLLVGWRFSKFNGQSSNRVIRLNSDWTVDTSFVYGSGFDSVMNKDGLHFLTNGIVEVHGYFTHYNGQSTISIDPWLAYSSRAFLGLGKPVIAFNNVENIYDTWNILISFSGSDPRQYTTGMMYQINGTGSEDWMSVDVFENSGWVITGTIILTWLNRQQYTIYIKWNNASGDVSYPVSYTFFVDLPDIIPPVVTLRWSSQITLFQWASFTDEWASWTDDVDGSGLISSPTSGSLQTNITWVYILEYTYTDHAWHAVTVNRSVTVIPQPFIIAAGWWWSAYISKDTCPQWDYSSSYYDNDCGTSPNGLSWNGIAQLSGLNEQQLAYAWALNLEIFSKKDRATGKITRAELAKIISIFATKVLDKQPWKKYWCERFKDFVSDKLTNEYIKLSCNLWIMWLEPDGKTPKKKFNPNRYVTRWEFWTALSRMLYGSTYDNNDGRRYRVDHLKKLKEVLIVTVVDPKVSETRDHVALLLYKSK